MKDLLIAIAFAASLIFAISSVYSAFSASVATLDASKATRYKPVAGKHAKYI